MQKTALHSLLTIALAVLLSACMSQAEKEFRAMSAVSQMVGMKNICWTESMEKYQHGLIAVFGEEPTGFFYSISEKEPKNGFYDREYMGFPLFNILSPVFYLPGLEGWKFEKIAEKANAYRLTGRKENDTLDTIVEITFDPAGRLLACQVIPSRDAREPICVLKVTKWEKVNGKEFPARAEMTLANGRKALWSYTSWQFDLPENEIRKIIEDKQKQLNKQPVKERSNP